ncbi:MAG: hypothetical protein D3910_21590 [Candidatus Electrothrix sp. ATG2]|nr:hypothetical protein [Candidatus Electrothrix sp. ATG2]
MLFIRETAGKKLLFWGTMEKYADMVNSSWSVAGDFVTYQRTASSSQKVFPAINRVNYLSSACRVYVFGYRPSGEPACPLYG